jgi:DHA1 family inner membrane transport protein
MWVLDKAEGAGQGLASSFNIAAFNLGNAIGAWLGGFVIDHGPGLGFITFVAGLVPLAALALALTALQLEKSAARLSAAACPEAAE